MEPERPDVNRSRMSHITLTQDCTQHRVHICVMWACVCQQTQVARKLCPGSGLAKGLTDGGLMI